jgi:hypothetical protein
MLEFVAERRIAEAIANGELDDPAPASRSRSTTTP